MKPPSMKNFVYSVSLVTLGFLRASFGSVALFPIRLNLKPSLFPPCLKTASRPFP